jgi:hypothetical protein
MNRYPNPDNLTAHWQRIVEINTEMGRRPLLGIGVDTLQPESLLILLALARLARRTAGPLPPRFVAGGEGELWLFTNLLWQSSGHGVRSKHGIAAIYGGSDFATYAATLNISALPMAASHPVLPPGMAWMLTPTAMPGSERSDLVYLPFVLRSPLFAPITVPPPPATWLDRLELWAALLLAAALVLAAFVR